MGEIPSFSSEHNKSAPELPHKERKLPALPPKESADQKEGIGRRDFLKKALAAIGFLAGIGKSIDTEASPRAQHKEQEPTLQEIQRDLFETREILPPVGKKFQEGIELWRKRYAGEDEEYDRLDLLYKKRKGLPLKTIQEELSEGWQRLVSQGDLATVHRITQEQGVPFDVLFLALSESHWKQGASSRVGAGGYWQFMPATAREYGLEVKKGNDERFDVGKSTRAACRYLKFLYALTTKQGIRISENDRWIWVFWAYNRGIGHVMEDLKRTKGNPNKYFSVCPNRESRNYAPKIFGVAKALRGIVNGSPQKRTVIRTASISQADQMFEKYSSSSFSSLQEKKVFLEHVLETYQKEAAQDLHSKDYSEDAMDVVQKEIESLEASGPSSEREDEFPTVVYEVKAGDNLGKIATWLSPSSSRIDTLQALIRRFNPKIRNWNMLFRGQEIVVPGTMQEVPFVKLEVLTKQYYPDIEPDVASKYLKWINGKNPEKEKILPGELILVPLSVNELKN